MKSEFEKMWKNSYFKKNFIRLIVRISPASSFIEVQPRKAFILTQFVWFIDIIVDPLKSVLTCLHSIYDSIDEERLK